MLENGAPHDQYFCPVYCLLHIEFHVLTATISVLGLLHFGSSYYLNFLQLVWVPLIYLTDFERISIVTVSNLLNAVFEVL